MAASFAFSKLNIEAYPNPAPVILEITAQAPGLSAEEMERYYTIPMEVGLAATPGVDVIRSTSFYGLSFVRVTFKYGIDYYFALTQAEISLQQNVSLPNNVMPSIQGIEPGWRNLSLSGQGPPHIGLTNLRTIQDWIVQRRLLRVEGVVQVNTWGGTTKEFEVEVDLHKLDAYNVTLPQVISAIGNANINVGGRTINFGQQSVNIRGIGLLDSGGAEDLTQGYRIDDIGNVVLAQSNGLPVKIKDVAKVYVGHVPRLGQAGRDAEDDIVAAIVVMNWTLHTNDVVPRIKAEIEKINSDGTLPPGVKLVPFYDRTTLVSVTTTTVLHNLIFGCLLVFMVQWVFLGNLRSAIIVGINIPFALFFSIIILVLRGEDANLLSVGAVDFGIIVDLAVILVENIFRNFQASLESRQLLLREYAEGQFESPSRPIDWAWRVVRSPAHHFREFAAGGQSGLVFDRRYHGRIRSIVHNARGRGPDLQPDGSHLRLRALRRIDRDVHRHSGTGLLPASRTRRGDRDAPGPRFARRLHAGPAMVAVAPQDHGRHRGGLSCRLWHWWRRGWAPNSCRRWKKAICGSARLCRRRYRSKRACPPSTGFATSCCSIRKSSPWSLSMAGRTMAAMPPVSITQSCSCRSSGSSDWPPGVTKEKIVEELQTEFANEFAGIGFNFSQYIQDNIEEGLSGVKGANSVKIIGRDLVKLEQISAEVMKEMAKVPGVTDLGVFPVLGQPNLNIRVDRERAARYGLNAGDINSVVQAALGGTTATTLLEADRQFRVTVRLATQYRDDIDRSATSRSACSRQPASMLTSH